MAELPSSSSLHEVSIRRSYGVLKSYHATKFAKVIFSNCLGRLLIHPHRFLHTHHPSVVFHSNGFNNFTLSSGGEVCTNTICLEAFLIGDCKTIYTASWALISTLLINLLPMSLTCCP